MKLEIPVARAAVFGSPRNLKRWVISAEFDREIGLHYFAGTGCGAVCGGVLGVEKFTLGT